jgi:stage II sporulation protein D
MGESFVTQRYEYKRMSTPPASLLGLLRLVSIAYLVCLVGCASTGKRAPLGDGHGPVIRALLGEEPGPFVVESKGGFHVESESGAVMMRSGEASRVNVRASEGSIQLYFEPQGTAAVAEGNIFITPFKSASLQYGGVAYPGRMLIRIDGDGPVQVINVVPLETYLEGVLPHEIGNLGPDSFAALEAQAITARTYAMMRIEARRAEPFDVYAGVRDQVYLGTERTNRLASGAVRDTRGMVVTYKGALAHTYYCATCGGHTADIRRVWPQREPARYLYGGLDRTVNETTSFCSWVRNFRWRFSFSGKQLAGILRRTIPAELGVGVGDVGSLIDIRVTERSRSGRARYLEVITTKGVFTVEGDRIRWVLMPDPGNGQILPSTMFDFEKEMRNGRVAFVSIVGGGNGHGVGMCQNGAIEMAKKGYTSDMILTHYYPGTELKTEY